MRFRWLSRLFLILIALGATPAPGQTVGASLQGTVRDGTGAAIAGADVVVSNVATAVSRELKTDEAGRYRVPVLAHRPGPRRDRSGARQGVSSSRVDAPCRRGSRCSTCRTAPTSPCPPGAWRSPTPQATWPPNWGRITSTVTTSRQIQLGLKYLF